MATLNANEFLVLHLVTGSINRGVLPLKSSDVELFITIVVLIGINIPILVKQTKSIKIPIKY